MDGQTYTRPTGCRSQVPSLMAVKKKNKQKSPSLCSNRCLIYAN